MKDKTIIQTIYILYDALARNAYKPLIFPNDIVALREFKTIVKSSDTVMAQNPQDFSLCKVGTFDTMTGLVTGYDLSKVCEAQVIYDQLIHEDIKNKLTRLAITDKINQDLKEGDSL